MKKAANTQAKDLMSEEINKKIATLKPVSKEFFELCKKNAEEILQGKLATFYLKVKYTKRMAELACQLNIGNREPDAVHDARIENAIVRGDWVYNGAKMQFYANGRMFDGGNRNTAINRVLPAGKNVLVDIEVRNEEYNPRALETLGSVAPVRDKEKFRRHGVPKEICGDIAKCWMYLAQYATTPGDTSVKCFDDRPKFDIVDMYKKPLYGVLLKSPKKHLYNPAITAIIAMGRAFKKENEAVETILAINQYRATMEEATRKQFAINRMVAPLCNWFAEYEKRFDGKLSKQSGTAATKNWAEVSLMTAFEYFSGRPLTVEKEGLRDFGEGGDIYCKKMLEVASKNGVEMFPKSVLMILDRRH